MKKIFLILILSTFIFLPKNVFALNEQNIYEVKCKTYNVDLTDNRSVLDYYYFTYVYTQETPSDYDFTLISLGTNRYNFFVYDHTTYSPGQFSPNSGLPFTADPNCLYKYNTDIYECNSQNRNTFPVPSSTINYLYSSRSIDFTYNNNALSFITANITQEEILSSYEDFCSSSGGNVNVEFPYNKNEFYTLLLLVGVLIMMLFFKWTFPMKGGRKI